MGVGEQMDQKGSQRNDWNVLLLTPSQLTSLILTLNRFQSSIDSKAASTLSMMTTGMHPFRMLSLARDEYPSPGEKLPFTHQDKA